MIDFVTVFNHCLFLTLVHSIWQFTALAIVSWAIGRLLRQNIEWNYAINVAALLLGLAAIPLTFLLVGNAELSRHNSKFENSNAVASRSNSSQPTDPIQKAGAGLNLLGDGWQIPTSAKTTMLFIFGMSSPWVAALYFSSVALMFTRLSFSIRRTGLINSHARPLSIKELDNLLQSLASAWSMKVVPKIALAEQIVVPKVIGLWRSTILLPASAITGLSQEDLKMILAHELAHVQRYDLWVNLIQRIAESVMFFNPAVWFISRRIESLREYCCDEKACRALEANAGDPSEHPRTRYAMALLRVVELAQESMSHESLVQGSINRVSFPKSEMTALAASGRSPSELRRRVLRLFGEPLREPIRLSRSSLLLGMIALLTLVGPTVWQSRAESVFPVSVFQKASTQASSEMQTFESVRISNGMDRVIVVNDDAANEPKNVIGDAEINLANVYVDVIESTKPISHQMSLCGRVVDEFGNPLHRGEAVLYDGFIARNRSQEVDTNINGMQQFLSLATNSRRRFIVPHDAVQGTGSTSRFSDTGMGLGRHHSKKDKVAHGAANEKIFLGGKLKHRIQNVFGRSGARKRTNGKQSSRPFQRRPLLSSRRS